MREPQAKMMIERFGHGYYNNQFLPQRGHRSEMSRSSNYDGFVLRSLEGYL